VRGNALLEAEWRPAMQPVIDAPQIRAVAAIAASLALPALDEERAAQLAEAEGLVTHLTISCSSMRRARFKRAFQQSEIALPHPSAASVPKMDMSFCRSSYALVSRYRSTPREADPRVPKEQ